jgi:hypothetical protein
MKHKVGDTVRIRSKEWMDAQEKDVMGSILISTKSCNGIVPTMQNFAGKLAKITGAFNRIYRIDIDNQDFNWEDWMFDSDSDYKVDEPLSAEDAIRAMLDGETLYDKEGNPRRFSDAEIESFMSLYRLPPKRKRLMNRWEAMDWAGSEASRGWAVRSSTSDWSLPQYFQYSEDIEHYQRVRVLPDLSGVDEDTIQGFEVEE